MWSFPQQHEFLDLESFIANVNEPPSWSYIHFLDSGVNLDTVWLSYIIPSLPTLCQLGFFVAIYVL